MVVVPARVLSMQEVEGGGEGQGCSWPHHKFEACLGCKRSCLKVKEEKTHLKLGIWLQWIKLSY